MKSTIALATLTALTLFPCAASAQLFAAKDAEVAMGHYHLNAGDIDEHHRFWTLLGGEVVPFFQLTVVQFHNALIFLSNKAPTGGTRGTAVNHFGFEVKDLQGAVNKVKGAGYKIITQQEVSGGQATSEIFSNPSQGVQLAFVQGPDDIKIELIGNPKLEKPIVAHHIHLASPDVDASVEWYHKHFGGTVGMRGAFREIRIAGIRLTFMDSEGPVKPTKGSALDHIGFEINGLKAYAAKLERNGVTFDRGYTQVARIKSAVAFLTDPVGTYIEVSEGLRQVGGIGPPAPLE